MSLTYNVYNARQKLTPRRMKEAPMSQLVDFVQTATTQERNKQEPCVPTEHHRLMTGVVPNPQVPTTELVPIRITPLKFQCANCAKWFLPRFERAHVERSVIFFSETIMNEARAATKETVQLHMKDSIQLQVWFVHFMLPRQKQDRRRCPPVSLKFSDWSDAVSPFLGIYGPVKRHPCSLWRGKRQWV